MTDTETAAAATDAAAQSDDAIDAAAWADAVRLVTGEDTPAPSAMPDVQPAETDAPADAAPAPDPAPEAPAAPAVDPWAAMTPAEQRAAYDAERRARAEFEREASAHRGRISKLMRERPELFGGKKPDAAADAEKKAPLKAMESADWKGAQDEYPEIAKPLGNAVGELAAEVATLRRDAEINRYAAQERELAARHPDWNRVTATPAFADWLARQPDYVQSAAYRNGEAIVDAYEASDILSRFKSDVSAPRSRAPVSPLARPAAAAPQPAAAPSPLAARRHRQIESAAAPRTRSPGPSPSGLPADPNAQWNWAVKEVMRDMGGR